jgi:hypothetical protein
MGWDWEELQLPLSAYFHGKGTICGSSKMAVLHFKAKAGDLGKICQSKLDFENMQTVKEIPFPSALPPKLISPRTCD